MKYLGLDLGSKTLGIAISDELGFLARALETYRFQRMPMKKQLNIYVLYAKEKKLLRSY